MDWEWAHRQCAEVLIADSNRIGSAPVLIRLQPSGRERDVGLERRLEGFVPVHQISQDRQSLGVQGVQPRAEYVGDSALIHKRSHLRLTNGSLTTVLAFHVHHGKS